MATNIQLPNDNHMQIDKKTSHNAQRDAFNKSAEIKCNLVNLSN